MLGNYGLKPRHIVTLLFILLALVLSLAPIILGIAASLSSPAETVVYPPRLLPSELSHEHYSTVFGNGLWLSLRVSLVYASVTVIFALLLGSITAYGLDRFRFGGRGLVLFVILSGIPLATGAAALIVPTYRLATWVGLTDTVAVLPIVYVAYTLPLVAWVLKAAMETVPQELDEAATVDGAGPLRILFSVVLPVMKPAIGAAALFAFVGAWNEFISGSVLVDSPLLRPIQVAVYQNIGFFGRDWGPLLASGVVAILPIVIVFIFFGRLMIRGLTGGALKG
ncbi:MAG: carbohydrate ABC transporter permease [Pseudomonadota bacterium]